MVYGIIKVKEGKKLREKKLEQLRTIFKAMVKDIIKKAKLGQEYFETDEHINTIVESLIYEVKIRIKEVK